MALFEIIYYSHNRRAVGEKSQLAKLREIVGQAQVLNARDGLTGFLLMRDEWFLQILEGDEARVDATYERIAADNRHEQCTIIRRRQIMLRSFPSWSMGGALFTPEQQGVYLQHGLNSTFDPRLLDAQTAHELLVDLQNHETDLRRVAS